MAIFVSNFLGVAFTLTCIYFFHCIFNTWNSIFHHLHSVGEACLGSLCSSHKFFTSRISSFCVFFIVFISDFRSWTVLFISLNYFVFLDFFKGFIDFLFKDLFHIHKDCFTFHFLFFSCDGIVMACCDRLAGFSRIHIVLAVIDFVFTLVFLVSDFWMIIILASDFLIFLCYIAVLLFGFSFLSFFGEEEWAMWSLACLCDIFTRNIYWCWRLGDSFFWQKWPMM